MCRACLWTIYINFPGNAEDFNEVKHHFSLAGSWNITNVTLFQIDL